MLAPLNDMYTKDKNTMIHFRLSDNDYNDLKICADQYNLSVSLFCRQILTMYLSERRKYNADLQTNINNQL